MVLEGSGKASFSWNEHASTGGDGDPAVDMKKIETWFDYDIEASNKKISSKLLTPKPEQENLFDVMRQLGPLGLKLTISPYFMNSLNSVLSSPAQETNTRTRLHKSHHHRRDSNHKMIAIPPPHPPRHEEYLSQPPSAATEKMKAANFPALSLKIGSWERVTIHEGDLVAKCYYAKKKLVWEFLEQRLKRKVEIQWSDITAIKATLNENEPGILQIELRQPPNFYDEIDPQPRKHTNWRPAEDFTGGQALMCRRHFLKFPAGVLDKHYEKLLQCDSRLFQLSQQHFPSSRNRYFPQQGEHMYNFADYSININHNAVSSLNIHAQQQLQAAYHQHIINPPPFSLDSPTSVIDLARMADPNVSVWGGNRREFQVQGANSFAAERVAGDQVQGSISNMASTDTTGFVYQNNNYVDAEMLLNEIENNMLTDSSNQEYCQDSAMPVDALMYNISMYQAGNLVSNIGTNNQHLRYEHRTAQQRLTDSTNLGYPPHTISWVAQPQQQPIPVAASPQNMCQDMSQAVSVTAMHQTITQAIMSSQVVSMAALPPHEVSIAALPQNEAPVNLTKSNALDEMMEEFYH